MSVTTFPYSIHISCSTLKQDDSVMGMSYEGTVTADEFKDNFISAASDLFLIHVSDEYERPVGTPSTLSKTDITTFFEPTFTLTTEEQERYDDVMSHLVSLMRLACRDADAFGTRSDLLAYPGGVHYEVTTSPFMFRISMGTPAN